MTMRQSIWILPCPTSWAWATILWGLGLMFWAVSGQVGWAQRVMGQPLERQAGPQRLEEVAETVGGLTGQERFLRESRQADEFVGADQADARFVGAGAVIETGRVRSAVETLPPAVDMSGQLNRPWMASAAGQPYPPQIVVAFEPPAGVSYMDRAYPYSYLWARRNQFQDNNVPQGMVTVLESDQRNALGFPPLRLPDSRSRQPLPRVGPGNEDFQLHTGLSARAQRSGIASVEVLVSGRTALLRGRRRCRGQRSTSPQRAVWDSHPAIVRNRGDRRRPWRCLALHCATGHRCGFHRYPAQRLVTKPPQRKPTAWSRPTR